MEAVTDDTPLAFVHVSWEQESDLLRCDSCGHRYVGDRLELCPCCGAEGVVIEPALPFWPLPTSRLDLRPFRSYLCGVSPGKARWSLTSGDHQGLRQSADPTVDH
jgi:hypothetical protein